MKSPISFFESVRLMNECLDASPSPTATASERSTSALKITRPRLGLRLRGERQVHGHLVAVEVGVECVADERMDLDRLALDEHRLEGLDAEAVQRGCPVQEDRVLRDHLLEDVPDLGRHRVDVLLRRLDVLDGLPLDEPAHDERLEELERHQLRQAALVQLEVR